MTTNRRTFLKNCNICRRRCNGRWFDFGLCPQKSESQLASIMKSVKKAHSQKFNMSGYAAPAIPVVRVGIIGLGDRGSDAVERLSYIEGVEIKALGDKREVCVKESQKYLVGIGRPAAKEFYGDENIWKKLVELPDLDLIYTCTPWNITYSYFGIFNGAWKTCCMRSSNCTYH